MLRSRSASAAAATRRATRLASPRHTRAASNARESAAKAALCRAARREAGLQTRRSHPPSLETSIRSNRRITTIGRTKVQKKKKKKRIRKSVAEDKKSPRWRAAFKRRCSAEAGILQRAQIARQSICARSHILSKV